jgi:hypothetical protein
MSQRLFSSTLLSLVLPTASRSSHLFSMQIPRFFDTFSPFLQFGARATGSRKAAGFP